MAALPPDLDTVIEKAWQLTQRTAGFLGENEARFLGMLAACVPARGAIVEIGGFKGKSTVMLASVAAHYGLGPVVAIDPHTSPSTTDPGIAASSSTFEEFLASVKAAGLTEHVEAHRAFSRDVAKGWNRPIRLLWIDGDHTFRGAKEDFDLFAPHVVKDGVVALHDALNAFEGPIRIFVEEILRSDQFGAAGVVQSTAWGQLRPEDGRDFRKLRMRIERRARRMLPFLANGMRVQGLTKMAYKLARSRVPRAPISAKEWSALVSRSGAE
ncbi:MAG TPA: class I SAM-dependent methyltransferase [Candidatus Polarisedimenticolia bacterium]|nr:class I SAM-dependent methyltransferase [Candidatus Polarisedimenticolia bacterium]